jgi:hypothetical protein
LDKILRAILISKEAKLPSVSAIFQKIMVLGIITSIAACPAIIGTTEAIRQGQSQSRREQQRGRKSNLLVTCSDPGRKARDIHGGFVVLRDQKVPIFTCF